MIIFYLPENMVDILEKGEEEATPPSPPFPSRKENVKKPSVWEKLTQA